ncbi:MAG: hypothetical protein QNK22_09130 [Xanthomonadales bacterium]|nr:hypothetical protein [Xanthomonadales bacterium]
MEIQSGQSMLAVLPTWLQTVQSTTPRNLSRDAWGKAGGGIDDGRFPQRMLIDYVRVYQTRD